MPFDFNNKVVLITGSSSGFGKALAEVVTSRGSKVVLGDIDEKAGRELASKYGDKAVFAKCDVTKRKDQQELFDLGIKTFGGLDVVINNAGIADYTNFYDDSEKNDKHWEACLRIDLEGVIIGNRIAFDYFATNNKKGIIINTASLAGIYPQPGQPVYGVAKAGVIQLTRSVGSYGEPYGIHSVAICPSFSPTGIISKGIAAIGEDFAEATADRVPVELVIEAFIYSIENAERLNGQAVRVTPKFGIDVYTFGRGKPFKL